MNGTGRPETLLAKLEDAGVSRRDFLKVCTLAAGAVGLPAWAGEEMAKKAASGAKPPIIWLHWQECTGCTESLLRTSAPDVAELILSLVSLDYLETLMAAAGHQAEAAMKASIANNKGKYICVVEGAIPMKDDGIYCRVAGRTAMETTKEVAENAAAVVAIGSCASFGGIPAADPNPTGAVGTAEALKRMGVAKPVVTLPGCPANPYNLLGTVLQLATFGTLPALDDLGRPKFAYARVIHEDCPRRPHFDAGRFAQKFGDDGHRQGYCLFKMGCKGPATHANCSLNHFVEMPGAWPIGIGHPCFGCTEQKMAFRAPLFQTVDAKDFPYGLTGPGTYPQVAPEQGKVSAVATGVAGLVGGALLGAGVMASKKLSSETPPEGGQKKE